MKQFPPSVEKTRSLSPRQLQYRWLYLALKQLKNPRCWLLIALLSGSCAILCHSPDRLLDRDYWVQRLEMTGDGAIFFFILAHVVLTAIGVPGTILTIAGGAVFGVGWGSLWSLIGATLGAIAAFWVARYLFHEWAWERFSKHPMMQRFYVCVVNRPWQFVLAVRLVPITPFNLVNFLFGLTPVPGRIYALGTFIGIAPGTLAYTWLGVTGKQALSGGEIWPLGGAIALLVLLSLLPLCWRQQ